jgi:hypothetical protein
VERLPASEGLPPVDWFRAPPSEVGRWALGLRRARERELLPRTNRSLVATLGRVGLRFLDPGDRLRRDALEGLPATAGVSAPMAREILDGMAADWVPERLEALLASEFPDPGVLEGFRPGPAGDLQRVLGDSLLLQVVSGSVPGVSATALLRGLLVRSATLVKPGRGDLLLPLLWMRGIGEEDPGLAEVAGVHYWPGGAPGAGEVEEAWVAEADRLVVYGGDDTVAAFRRRVPAGVRVVAYPHRISVGLLGREESGSARGRVTAREAARAVSLFDGRGCVTPQLLFVEGSMDEVLAWARLLGEGLEELSRELPPGRLSASEAARVQHLRAMAELSGAAGRPGGILTGAGTSWTVVVSGGEEVEGSCPGRVVRVVAVHDLGSVPQRLRPLAAHLQSAVLEVGEDRRPALAEALARIGVPRITTLARVPWPPAWWHHDGDGPLQALACWVDLEGPGVC